ncbi:hypothetical protein ACFYZE_20995 [Streptomyces sp. NPDC001796]|uniref:hypothetical protein n=1 Tax=Streptomyces sp. NPDC001796 TaxID=3364609 RepID=UPI003693E69C
MNGISGTQGQLLSSCPCAQKKLDAPPTVTRKKKPPLSDDQIREITERLGGITQGIQAADADTKEPLYEALGITITYDNATRTATVRSRPSIPYRYKECPRGELTADDTVVTAQGHGEHRLAGGTDLGVPGLEHLN